MSNHVRFLLVATLLSAAPLGCGEEDGADRAECTVEDNGDGTLTLVCGDTTLVVSNDADADDADLDAGEVGDDTGTADAPDPDVDDARDSDVDDVRDSDVDDAPTADADADIPDTPPGDTAEDAADGADAADEDADEDTDISSCSGCHGSDLNAAPPMGLGGETETRELAVGAHQAHLANGPLAAPLDCSDCHIVPTEVYDEGHLDEDAPAEVTFGALARGRGAAPVWNRETRRCSEVYCHGSELSAGFLTEPSWTAAPGTQSVCGACHGLPPSAPHLPRVDCPSCHNETLNAAFEFDLDLHINGTVEVASECNACHGSDANPAPPNDTAHRTDSTEVTVGAHQAHVTDGEFREALWCDACHSVPEFVRDPGHLDASPAELVFGTIARSDGADPAWNRESAQCGNSYCHGATLSGGVLTDPVWTEAPGSQVFCGSCHGAPPPPPHIQRTDCASCHAGTVSRTGEILTPGAHIDGELQVEVDCSACHGSDENPAPPRDTIGRTASSFVTVGAHQAHVTDTDLSDALSCDACHRMPERVDDPTHIDLAPAEINFGDLARTRGGEPTWNRAEARCSNVYCHGEGIGGGFNMDPIWNAAAETQVWCGSCHALPPAEPHPQFSECFLCHPATISPEFEINPSTHINGTVDRF